MDNAAQSPTISGTLPGMTLFDHLHDHLLVHGPKTEEQLLHAMRMAGRTTARTTTGVRTALRASLYAVELPDGCWDVATRLLVGSVLTTRPRAVPRDGVLWVDRDLEPFDGLLRSGAPLATGGQARWHERSGIRTVVGPDGWLPSLARDDVLGVRWDGTLLHVERVQDVPDGDSAVVLAARRVLAAHAQARPARRRRSYYGYDEEATSPTVLSVVLSALQEDPELFRSPLPPLSELLPLPEPELSGAQPWTKDPSGRPLALLLPERLHEELLRRSALLGDRPDTYAAMLLGAALDRVRPPCEEHARDPYLAYDFPYETYGSYETHGSYEPHETYAPEPKRPESDRPRMRLV